MREEDTYAPGRAGALRQGYTTGTCAAGAAQAAARFLLSGVKSGEAAVTVPRGDELSLPVEAWEFGPGWASCGIRKDAGDDPDVTDGILICARVSKTGTGGDYEQIEEGISLYLSGGVGIGRVTKPGLSCKVGEPAINPIPREMIFAQVARVCREAGFLGRLWIEIFSPQGAEAAGRTFNPRLGIEGGISILGTSGIVEPMSRRALLDTIRLELRQKSMASNGRVAAALGNYGERFLEELGVCREQVVICSNYIGDTLDMAREEGVKEILFVGHAGKLIKTAAGIMDTHSRTADGRMEILGAWGAACGADPDLTEQILQAVTVDQGLAILETQPGLKERTMERIMGRMAFYLSQRAGDGLGAEAIVFTNERGILGMTPGAGGMLARLKQGCADA